MKTSAIKGFAFGLTSGIITTLGMMVGLYSTTGSRLVVIGGILSIAIADSFSDALGMHISEESDNQKNEKEVWAATITTFTSKLLFSLTFIIPAVTCELNTAILISASYGLILLAILSYFIAKNQKENPIKVISEHLFIAILVIVITHLAGDLISQNFS